jgi:hypothetical protein
MVESKIKKSPKKKNSGNSVCPRIHEYSIHRVYLGIYIVFAKARTPMFFHDFKLFSIVYNALIHLQSTEYCMLEPKVKKDMYRL